MCADQGSLGLLGAPPRKLQRSQTRTLPLGAPKPPLWTAHTHPSVGRGTAGLLLESLQDGRLSPLAARRPPAARRCQPLTPGIRPMPCPLPPAMSRLLHWQLLDAAGRGDVPALRACLEAGADPGAAEGGMGSLAPLLWATARGRRACVELMLAAGASPNRADALGWGALHHATLDGCEGCIPALLAAGAHATAVSAISRWTPLHCAARCGNAAAAAMLVSAAPEAVACRDGHGKTPLALALAWRRIAAARCLLELAPLQPAGDVLALLSSSGKPAMPLYASLVARQPLTPEQWAQVPTLCPGLAAALPAVLLRSTAEAGALVRRLPLADRARLRTAALCLGRTQQCLPAPLPIPIVWHVLALAVAL